MAEKNGLSVIVPMYNEAENVVPLVEEIMQALAALPAFECIIVDDGSQDGTGENLLSCATQFPQLKVLRHDGNFGQSASIVSGVRAAQYDWITTLDGDGQNDPADIPKLFEQAQAAQKPVLITGHRVQRHDTPLRRISSRIANAVRRGLLNDDCPDTGCSLKIFPRDAFLTLPPFRHMHRFLPGLFKRAGLTLMNMPVNHRPRLRGQSKYGLFNRLGVGIVDLFGVMWLLRRACHPEIRHDDA